MVLVLEILLLGARTAPHKFDALFSSRDALSFTHSINATHSLSFTYAIAI